MIFRQLFEDESSTYTYLLGCEKTGNAILIDPVLETVERDLDVVRSLGLNLTHTLDTHIHADHITAACRLRVLVGSKVAYPANENLPCPDLGVVEGEAIISGDIKVQPLFTPGHTDTHHAYVIEAADTPRVFTGDSLLIDGCGRTDFQNGNANTLYRSVHDKLFTMPGETLVYPGHDYEGRLVSSIKQERVRNPRLSEGIGADQFATIMADLDLPYPKKIEIAVPANLKCGNCAEEEQAELARIDGNAPQG